MKKTFILFIILISILDANIIVKQNIRALYKNVSLNNTEKEYIINNKDENIEIIQKALKRAIKKLKLKYINEKNVISFILTQNQEINKIKFLKHSDNSKIDKITRKTIKKISKQFIKPEQDIQMRYIISYNLKNKQSYKHYPKQNKYNNKREYYKKSIQQSKYKSRYNNKKSIQQSKYKNRYNIKIYNSYHGYKKLISDSEIKIREDNRFISNSIIYGIYKYQIHNIKCGQNPNIYKINNECSGYSFFTIDKLYFSKSNINELRNFNTKDHQIECTYSQEYGIMHDCKVKIFKYIF
jgi:hypothetical protein